MAPKRPLPSDTPGGGGDPSMSAEAHFGTLFWVSFFSMLFQMFFLRLRTLFWRFWASILATLGGFFWVFSYLGVFLKIALPCRRELKNQGPGITEIAQKSNKKCIWLWDCFGKQVFKEITQFWFKHCSKRYPKLEPKLAWCAGRTPHFQPWVNMVAQVVPNGAQSGSKGAQRLPKWRKNAVQGLQNVCPKLAEKREAATKA